MDPNWSEREVRQVEVVLRKVLVRLTAR
jgi:hypothetical protein